VGCASILLLHGLVAGPLFVRCILADGQTILEVLGQDPHQQRSPNRSAGARECVLSTGAAGCADPCTDMWVDNPGALEISVSRLLRITGADAVFDLIRAAAEPETQPSEAAPHPVSANARPPSPAPSLRI
jgi:hypothetical protein